MTQEEIDREFIRKEHKTQAPYEELKKVSIRVLSDFRSELNLVNLVFQSCQKNDFMLIKNLIDVGVDFNVKSRGETPLHITCLLGPCEYVKILVESGVDINHKNEVGWTPLNFIKTIANKPKDLKEIIDFLIQNGAYE